MEVNQNKVLTHNLLRKAELIDSDGYVAKGIGLLTVNAVREVLNLAYNQGYKDGYKKGCRKGKRQCRKGTGNANE